MNNQWRWHIMQNPLWSGFPSMICIAGLSPVLPGFLFLKKDPPFPCSPPSLEQAVWNWVCQSILPLMLVPPTLLEVCHTNRNVRSCTMFLNLQMLWEKQWRKWQRGRSGCSDSGCTTKYTSLFKGILLIFEGKVPTAVPNLLFMCVQPQRNLTCMMFVFVLWSLANLCFNAVCKVQLLNHVVVFLLYYSTSLKM